MFRLKPIYQSQLGGSDFAGVGQRRAVAATGRAGQRRRLPDWRKSRCLVVLRCCFVGLMVAAAAALNVLALKAGTHSCPCR